MELRQRVRELQDLGQKKEELWQRLQQDKGERGAMAEAVKALREKRDSITREVAVLKQERGRLQAVLEAKRRELEAAREGQKQLMGGLGIRESPESVRRKIQALEQKVETQVISFEKEKQVMDAVRRLKKQMAEAGKLRSASGAVAQRAAELRELQVKDRSLRKRIQEQAAASHQCHMEMLARRGELDALRARQKADFAAYDAVKQQKRESAAQLQSGRRELALRQDGQMKARQAAQEAQEKETELQLQEKEKVLEEKIRKKKKITTEDLLVFRER